MCTYITIVTWGCWFVVSGRLTFNSHLCFYTSFALPCSIVLRVWLDGRPCGVRLAAHWTPLHHLLCPSKNLDPPFCISLNIWVGTYWQGAPTGRDAAAAIMAQQQLLSPMHMGTVTNSALVMARHIDRQTSWLCTRVCIFTHEAAGGAVTMHVSNLLPALCETRKAPICCC